MKMTVARVSDEPGVRIFEFRHPRRPALPPFEAGAHVDVHLPDGRVRQYSLCGDPRDTSRYTVAVKREDGGRGGSTWLHENVAAGQVLPVSAPRNHFGLSDQADFHLLLAGGIGITPMLAMARTLSSANRDFELHYFARSRGLAPLLAEIQDCLPQAHVHLHFDDEAATRVDLGVLLTGRQDSDHVYYCGPPGFMAAIRDATAEWPGDRVHFEAFQSAIPADYAPLPFSLKLRKSGRILEVPAESSALAVLRAAGIPLSSSCENGVCGTCECGYTEGEPVHLDAVLDPAAHSRRFIPCVSRANGQITLDL